MQPCSFAFSAICRNASRSCATARSRLSASSGSLKVINTLMPPFEPTEHVASRARWRLAPRGSGNSIVRPWRRRGMPEQAEMMEWRGCEVVDQDGDKVGKLDEIYIDRETSKPEWAVVNTGLFGRKSSFVPLKDALREGEMIRVPYQKEHIKEAPSVDPDGEISPEEEQRVYAHYGLDYSQAQSGSGLPQGETGASSATAANDSGVATTAAGSGVTAEGGTGAPAGSGGDGPMTGADDADGTTGTPGTEQSELQPSAAGGAVQPGSAGGDVQAGGTGGTGGTQSGGGGLRLQRMIQEDIRMSGEGDEVVERRTVQEERLSSEADDANEGRS